MKCRTSCWVGMICCWAWLGTLALGAAEPVNWLKNGSFEQAAQGKPAGWSPQKWSGGGDFDVRRGRPHRQTERC